MTTDTLDYLPGNLVRARGREWVVQADTHQGDGGSLLRLRPLGGADEDIITLIPELEFEPVTPATFAWPTPSRPATMPPRCCCAMPCASSCARAAGRSARLATLPLNRAPTSWCRCSWPCG